MTRAAEGPGGVLGQEIVKYDPEETKDELRTEALKFFRSNKEKKENPMNKYRVMKRPQLMEEALAFSLPFSEQDALVAQLRGQIWNQKVTNAGLKNDKEAWSSFNA